MSVWKKVEIKKNITNRFPCPQFKNAKSIEQKKSL